MNPKFTGVWLPKEILEHENLSVTAKMAYGIIDGLDGEDGCYASNGYLGRILGVSERQVKNIVGDLLDAGVITRVVHSNAQGSVRYLHTVARVALLKAGEEKNCTEGVKPVARGEGSKVPPYRKEDKKEDINTVVLPYGEAFKLAWEKWVGYRKEIKKPMKPTTVREQLALFASWNSEENSVASINKSIAFGWQGVFVVNGNNAKTKPTLTSQDHANGF
jgi:hypothetical protein